MPSISRGLYHWLFQRAAVLEDFADRLNHFWTVGLLLLFACIISWKHGFNKPINCWSPAEFTGSRVEYAESLCWHSYFIQYPRDRQKAAERLNISIDSMSEIIRPLVSDQRPLDSDGSEMSQLTKASTTVTLYQWLPLILCLQALLFKLPNIILYVFHTFTGVSFDKIASLTLGYANMNLQERQELGRQIARYLSRWCSLFGNCLPWRLLTLVWLLVKALYCVNVIVQLFFLDAYLTTSDPPVDNSTSYGTALTDNIYECNATVWKESPAFPRRVLCDYGVKGYSRIIRFTVDCHLPANDFNEHAYMFIWVWFVFVAVVTCLSLVVWLTRTVIPVFRKRYITKQFETSDCINLAAYPPSDFDNFCDVIGEDGVMVLKLTSANSSEFVVRDVVCYMWTQRYGVPGNVAGKATSSRESIPDIKVD